MLLQNGTERLLINITEDGTAALLLALYSAGNAVEEATLLIIVRLLGFNVILGLIQAGVQRVVFGFKDPLHQEFQAAAR